MEEREQLVFYPSVEEDSFEDETQNMYLALCLTSCWKPSFFKSLIWLKTVTRVMPVVGISTQLSSILASKILLQLFETLGKSWKSWKIMEIMENLAHLAKDQRSSIFFPFSYLRKAFISAVWSM